ncbi:MAG: hypothetical protein K8R02_06380 [Anaerohalosphaeraceae bacterium]|nr:hypothetical protein [Anaerohalosphaeraceae bacterium]
MSRMGKQSVIVSVVMFCTLMLAANLQAAVLYETGFETSDGFSDNASINGRDGWVVEDGSCVTRNNNKLGELLSLEVVNSGSNGKCRISFSANAIITAEFKAHAKDSTSMFYFYLMDSNNKRGPCIYFNSGKLRAYNGSSIVDIMNASINTTYAIKMVGNASSGVHTYDVYVNGVLKADNFSFRESTSDTLSRFRILRGTTSIGVVDNLSINSGAPAFPTAEGFGAWSRGGRGGNVYHVTNLNDSGSGSLRYGIENSSSPRTIVFDVSGTIALQSTLVVPGSADYLTIAGQTAPGDGICLKNYGMKIDYPDDIIIRYIRFRPGDTAQTGVSAVSLTGTEDIIFDHCSFSWGVDQLWGLGKICDNITVQWSILSEALYDSYHEYGVPHSMGALFIPSSYECHMTFHHNLFAHNDKRNPRAGSKSGGKSILDWRNNVVYNWGEWCGRTGTSDRTEYAKINYVNNYLKYGPDTLSSQRNLAYKRTYDAVLGMYVTGNYMPHYSSGNSNNWLMMQGTITHYSNPRPAPMVKTDTASTAYNDVLDYAGVSPRDDVDDRVVGHVDSSGYTAGAIIDSQSEVGGWPTLSSSSCPTDSDQDGMPNSWESSNGLNPYDAADRNYDSDKDGYTNLEEYLSWLVGEGDGC